jgi:hypothetical protein
MMFSCSVRFQPHRFCMTMKQMMLALFIRCYLIKVLSFEGVNIAGLILSVLLVPLRFQQSPFRSYRLLQ